MVIEFINTLCRLFFYPLAIALGMVWLYGVYRAIRHRERASLFFAIIILLIVAGCFVCRLGSSRYMAIFLIPGIAYILYGMQQFRRGRKSTLLILTLLIVCAVAGAIKSFRFVRRSELPAACMRIQADSHNYQTPAIINLTKEKNALQFYGRIPLIDDLTIKPLTAITHNQLHRLLQRYQYEHDAIYFVFWQKHSEKDHTPQEFGLQPSQWQKIFRGKVKKGTLDFCIFRYTFQPPEPSEPSGKTFSLPFSQRTGETAPISKAWKLDRNFYITEMHTPQQDHVGIITPNGKTAFLIQSPKQAAIRSYPLDIDRAYKLGFTFRGVTPGGFLEVVLVKGDLPTKKIYKEEMIARIPITDDAPHEITLFLWRDMIRQDEYARLLFRVKPGNVILSDLSFAPAPDMPFCDFDR